MNLRPYQQQGVEALRAAFRAGALAPLYVAPTGSGKTVLFTHIARGATQRGNTVWILVHRQELLFQTSRALDALHIEHGVVAPGFTPSTASVQVCSVQTLKRRVEQGKLKPADLIVIDEAHHATAGSWRAVVKALPDARLLGVTATPERLDGQGLGEVFDALVIGPTVAELIRDGWLCRPVVFAPPTQLDLSGVKSRAGDFAMDAIASRIDKPTITGDVIAHYKRLCDGKPAIAFCASVAHAQHVAEQFRAAGYRATSLDGKMGDAERKTAVAALGDGRMQVLTSCEIISEGIDIPIVAAAILLRPTQSLALYLQQVGRALRPAPGKHRALILDHVGNVMRHGLPDDERKWTLDNVPRSARERDNEPGLRVAQCPSCFAAHHPAPSCPSCGHVYAPALAAPKQVEGTLTEITPEQVQSWREDRKREVGRAKTREELEAIAVARGYKPSWVHFVLKSRGQRSGKLAADG